MTRRYAEDTKVPVDRTRHEIERTLTRYNADGFLFGHDQGRGMVAFRMHGRQIRMFVAPIDRTARDVTHTASGSRRPTSQHQARVDQLERQRWRALLLILKAKLEAIATGAVTFDEEFLPHIVLPSGATVGEWINPQIDHVYDSGDMPALLPGVSGALEAGR